MGGGSTVGLGKAIALESSLPILAIPTTYAGSEMTPIYGVTENGLKRTGTDPRVLPRTVLYDPQLSLSLPVDLSVASGINAMAHAAEGLYAVDANPVMSLMAEEGIAAGARLAGLRRDAADPRARATRCTAPGCAARCWAMGMALHHKLCHTLGGSFNLPHAQTHAIILPHALAYNTAAAPRRCAGSRAHSAPRTRRAACTPLRAPWARRCRWPTSACAWPTWTGPPTSPSRIRIGIRVRSSARALLQDAFDGRRRANTEHDPARMAGDNNTDNQGDGNDVRTTGAWRGRGRALRRGGGRIRAHRPVAASMLGRAGYRVMVIERWPTPYGLPRLTHIDGETARIVQASGEIQRALRSAKAVDTYHYRDAAGDLLLELNWSGRACGYPAHISIYQPDIEDAVEARAKGYPNVTVLRGWEVDTLKQDEQGVTLSAHPGAAARTRNGRTRP